MMAVMYRLREIMRHTRGLGGSLQCKICDRYTLALYRDGTCRDCFDFVAEAKRIAKVTEFFDRIERSPERLRQMRKVSRRHAKNPRRQARRRYADQ